MKNIENSGLLVPTECPPSLLVIARENLMKKVELRYPITAGLRWWLPPRIFTNGLFEQTGDSEK
jgi:hypothetical protein